MESIGEQFPTSEQKMEFENVRHIEIVRLSTSCTRKENLF